MSGKNYDFQRYFKGNERGQNGFIVKSKGKTQKANIQKPRKMNASRTSN